MFFFSRLRGFFVFGLAIALPLLPLLAPHADGLLGALAGSGVGVRPLAADRQTPAVPDPLVRTDLDLALDVLSHVAAEIALDLVAAVDEVADPDDLLVGEIANLAAPVEVHAGHDLPGPGGADPVDVPKGDVHPLVAGEVHACDPSHTPVLLPLPLLVARVRADHHDPAVAADQLAPLAHLLHRRTNLHAPAPPLTGTGRRSALASGRTARAPPAPGPPGGSGCNASASSPRCGPAPCARCPAPPGTWHWAAARQPLPRPPSRPSSPS